MPRKPKTQNKKKKTRKSAIAKPLKTGVYMFKESFNAGTYTCGTGAGFYCAINSIPELSHYQNLFDYYRVTGWKLQFQPRYESIDTASTLTVPRIYYKIERGKTLTAPSSETSAITGMYRRVKDPLKLFSIYIAGPTIANIAYAAAADRYDMVKPKWLELQTAVDVPHYGLEMYGINNGTANMVYDMIWTLYFKVKSPN